jgi:hypothetical protein
LTLPQGLFGVSLSDVAIQDARIRNSRWDAFPKNVVALKKDISSQMADFFFVVDRKDLCSFDLGSLRGRLFQGGTLPAGAAEAES